VGARAAAPGRWARTNHAAEHSAEVCLVAHSAPDRNLGERLPRRTHHRARKLDAPPGDVVAGSYTYADLECPKELRGADLDEIRKIRYGDFVRQVCLDVANDAIQLPCHQSTSFRQPGALNAMPPAFYAKECRCAQEVAARSIPIRIESQHCGIDEARNGCGDIFGRVHARAPFLMERTKWRRSRGSTLGDGGTIDAGLRPRRFGISEIVAILRRRVFRRPES